MRKPQISTTINNKFPWIWLFALNAFSGLVARHSNLGPAADIPVLYSWGDPTEIPWTARFLWRITFGGRNQRWVNPPLLCPRLPLPSPSSSSRSSLLTLWSSSWSSSSWSSSSTLSLLLSILIFLPVSAQSLGVDVQGLRKGLDLAKAEKDKQPQNFVIFVSFSLLQIIERATNQVQTDLIEWDESCSLMNRSQRLHALHVSAHARQCPNDAKLEWTAQNKTVQMYRADLFDNPLNFAY